MNETIYIGSPSAAWISALFFLTVSLVIGYVIYGILSRPSARRAEFLHLGAASRRASLLIAGFVSAAVFTLICWSTFKGFHRIEVHGERLRLVYFVPPRAVELRRDEFTLLEKRYAFKLFWRLAITTASGRTYESHQATSTTIEAARLRLAQVAAE